MKTIFSGYIVWTKADRPWEHWIYPAFSMFPFRPPKQILRALHGLAAESIGSARIHAARTADGVKTDTVSLQLISPPTASMLNSTRRASLASHCSNSSWHAPSLNDSVCALPHAASPKMMESISKDWPQRRREAYCSDSEALSR